MPLSRLEPDLAAERERAVLDEWKATHDMPPPLVTEPADGRLPALTPEARVIALGDERHVADTVRSYMGDARGRWDGDTLVVETTNFNGRPGRTPVETKGWTVAYTLTPAPDYAWSEYACHEGNYSMRNLLSISRAAEGTPVRPPRPRR